MAWPARGGEVGGDAVRGNPCGWSALALSGRPPKREGESLREALSPGEKQGTEVSEEGDEGGERVRGLIAHCDEGG